MHKCNCEVCECLLDVLTEGKCDCCYLGFHYTDDEYFEHEYEGE